MEGAGILLIVLLAVFFVGVVIRDRIKGDGSQVKGPPTPKSRVLSVVFDGLKGKTHSDLGGTRYWYDPTDPPGVFTLSADIEEFAYIRPTANSWHHSPFADRDLAAQWRRKPAARRIWDAINLVVPLAIPAAFRADSRIQTVRFHIGNLNENERISTCRVSVEAKRGQHKDEWDWRYKRNGKGQLGPVAPHEDAPAPAARPRGFAADPREFELQVAQALQARGLSVEVTGGAGDEGVDIIARDPAPVTGGTYLVQCKRYAPDRKVGVAEVRELYGALQEKRASKGILATTASFTTPAIRFAEDKPLELLDGAQLAAFIGAHAPAPSAASQSDLDSELLEAAAQGDASSVALLLDRGADIEASNDIGWTPLHLAAAHNAEPAVAALLLDRGADIEARDNDGWMPLHMAAANNAEPAVAALLIDRGADIEARTEIGFTPLHWAAALNAEPAVAALLLDRGADIQTRDDDGWTPLHRAASGNSNPAVAALLIDRGADIEAVSDQGATPLHAAAEYNAEPTVHALLLDRGANISARTDGGVTPLQVAAANNAEAAVTALLLDHGADIAARNNDGWTPLHAAAAHNAEPAVAALLIDRGASVEARNDNGLTPLHAAAAGNAEPAVAALLIDRGADIEAVSEDGWTPLQVAAANNAEAAVTALLLDHGADIEARDGEGETPLHAAAAENPAPAVVQLLIERGADLSARANDGATPYGLAAEREEPNEEILRLLRA